jgi:16S rRNA processing protein RimM
MSTPSQPFPIEGEPPDGRPPGAGVPGVRCVTQSVSATRSRYSRNCVKAVVPGEGEGPACPRNKFGEEGEGQAPSVLVGVVTGPHGISGAVRIKSFTAEPEGIASYGPLCDATGRRFALKLVGAGKGILICRLSGIDDRNRAEGLRGLRLFLPRSALPPAAVDEFYHADLIGLAAVTGDGTAIGKVRAVHDFGAGDTLEIERAAAPPAMVPFTRAIVPVVDLEAGRLVIDPPPGLLDDVRPARRPARMPA